MMRNQKNRSKPGSAVCVGILFACVSFLPDQSFSQPSFYQGKTVTVIATTSPGGTGDLRVKALVPFLRKYIPGNPTLVIEYMDGGGGPQRSELPFP